MILSLNYGGMWWVTLPRDEWPDDGELVAELEHSFEGPYGDRRQELVIIGIDLKRPHIIEALHTCLLTDAEMAQGPQHWTHLPDPFPTWV